MIRKSDEDPVVVKKLVDVALVVDELVAKSEVTVNPVADAVVRVA